MFDLSESCTQDFGRAQSGALHRKRQQLAKRLIQPIEKWNMNIFCTQGSVCLMQFENKTNGGGLKIYRKATESRGQQDKEVNERSDVYLRGQVTRKRRSAKHRSLPDEEMNLIDQRCRT